MSIPEQIDLRLGFIPLVDCAPLAVAMERGLFAAEGLEVVLSREASWANIRDKVQMGLLDGAHMLGPMALASSLGAGGERVAMIAPMALNLNGSAVTIAVGLADQMRALDPEGMAAHPRTARPLARVIEARRARGDPPLTFAAVFPFSMHAYELRYWLAEAGIDPDRDVRLAFIPPPRMAARLRSGEVDGFCVGAPWNTVAEDGGDGEILVLASDLWSLSPDKVFGVTQAWAERRPETLQAVLRALIRAAAWADASGNRAELASILARPDYVDAPEPIIRRSLEEVVFHRHAAGFPWLSHGLWFLSQMLRWGQIGEEVDLGAAARAVYRPELFRAAAARVGAPAPLIDQKVEGGHLSPWTLEAATRPIAMAADGFFDGRRFDPDAARAYADSFPVRVAGERAQPF